MLAFLVNSSRVVCNYLRKVGVIMCAKKIKLHSIYGDFWNSMRKQFNKPLKPLGELLDNCIDADARRVAVNYKCGAGGALVIKDDGEGMNAEGLDRMFSFGGSTRKDDHGASGTNGFGAKPSLAWFGDVFDVKSVRDGVVTRWKWDTRKDKESNEWGAGLTQYKPRKAKAGEVGTTITVTELANRRRSDSLIRAVQSQFTPAIDEGLEFVFDGVKLDPIKPPWVQKPRICTIDVQGQQAVLQIGRVVKDHPDARDFIGVNCVRTNRYVPALTGWRDPVEMLPITVLVRLTVKQKKDWELTNVKDSLADSSLADELKKAIREACEPEIKACRDESVQYQTKMLEDILNDMAGRVFKKVEDGDAKPKKKRGGGGNGGGGGDGKLPEKAKGDPDQGDTHRNAGAGSLKFMFHEMDSVFTSVKFDKGLGVIEVHFNTQSPAYDAQKPDHAMYFAVAAQAIGVKMLENPAYVRAFPGWAEILGEHAMSERAEENVSEFALWFQLQIKEEIAAVANGVNC